MNELLSIVTNSVTKGFVFSPKRNCQLVQFLLPPNHQPYIVNSLWTHCAYLLATWSVTENKTSNLRKKQNKKHQLDMKWKRIRHHIYSCLHSLQLWSDETSQSNLFRKYHCRLPLFLTMLISSAVKHIMMSRAVIKRKLMSLSLSLLGCSHSKRRACAAKNSFIHNFNRKEKKIHIIEGKIIIHQSFFWCLFFFFK